MGKSFFAVNLVQYLKDMAVAHIAIDTDNENSTLKRFHSDAVFVDIASPRRLDGVFDGLTKANLAVVDGRAASSDLVLDYFGEIGLPGVLAELGASLTLAIPINHESDSVEQVQRFADQLGGACQYLIVRNAAHSDSFALYERMEIRGRLAREFGGREIDMPRLQDWLVEALNREDLTVTAATRHPSIGLLDRQRLISWQRRLYGAIESVRPLIMDGRAPGSHSQTPTPAETGSERPTKSSQATEASHG